MIETRRTDSTDRDFRDLVAKLDAYLAVVDGDKHAFFDQFNKLDKLRHAVVVHADGVPAACGAIRAFDEQRCEIKRMFVDPAFRRRGLARHVLTELETWSRELGFTECILETARHMPDAVGLYLSSGYTVIPNYGQYAGVETSVCLAKTITG